MDLHGVRDGRPSTAARYGRDAGLRRGICARARAGGAAGGEPLAPVVQHRLPSSQWRRYDKMRRFPDGLLVTGDAMCSFNPIYGQGMSVAGMEAVALRSVLHHGDTALSRRYFAPRPSPSGWRGDWVPARILPSRRWLDAARRRPGSPSGTQTGCCAPASRTRRCTPSSPRSRAWWIHRRSCSTHRSSAGSRRSDT